MFKAPVLDEQELAVISRINGVKESLKYAVRDVPHRWQGLLRRNTFARNIRGSNRVFEIRALTCEPKDMPDPFESPDPNALYLPGLQR